MANTIELDGFHAPDYAPGVFLLDLASRWPAFWETVKQRPLYSTWSKLVERGLDESALADAIYSNVTAERMRSFVDAMVSLKWMRDMRGSEHPLVEADDTFPMDVNYSLTMAWHMSLYGTIPSEDEFWETWTQLNRTSLEQNLTPVFAEGKRPVSTVARLMAVCVDGMNPEGARQRILTAANYRCKKAYTGLIREFYTLAQVTESVNRAGLLKPIPPCMVLVHPLLDSCGKCDGVVIEPEKGAVVPLAVYLKTDTSNHHIRYRKAYGVLSGKLLNVAVECKTYRGVQDAIYLPDDGKIFSLRLAVGGVKSGIAAMQGAYT